MKKSDLARQHLHRLERDAVSPVQYAAAVNAYLAVNFVSYPESLDMIASYTNTYKEKEN